MTNHKTELEEKVEETTEQPAPAVETNTDKSESEKDTLPAEVEPPKVEETDLQVDYALELEEAQAKLVRAENKIIKLKRKQDVVEPVDMIDQQEELEQLEQRLTERQDEKLALIRSEALGESLNNAIQSFTNNPDEEKLIRFHIENSIKPSGNIVDDVRRAKLLANEKKIASEVVELRQSLVSKHTASVQSFNGQKQNLTQKPIPTSEDIRIANQMFNGDVERYLKHKK